MAETKNRSQSPEGWFLSERARSWVLAFTFPSAFILGTIGYLQYPAGDEPVSLSNALYHAAQLFIMHSPHFETEVPWTLEMARWLAAASTGLVLFNAALHLFQHERMALVLRRRRQHAIICGLGRRGITVAEKLHKAGTRVVAIDKAPEQDIIERLEQLGIPLITGDASRKEILRQARIGYADKIFTLCPDDTINFSIAMMAHDMECRCDKPRQCFIHVNDAELRNAMQTNYQQSRYDTRQTLRFIDAYGPEAISLLVQSLPLDQEGISPDDERGVHLVILGFGNMGRTIAVKAAQLGRFANRKPLRISVIDRQADTTHSELLFHHPFIGEVADFHFFQQEGLSLETRSMIEKWCSETGMLVNVVICFDNPSLAYDTVFNLFPFFNWENVRVAVRVNEQDSFSFLLEGAGAKSYEDLSIIPFGVEKNLENLTEPGNDPTEKFAMDIHKAYMELVKKEYKDKPEELKGKQLSGELNEWEDLREDFRESNRQQAVHIIFKLKAAGLEMVTVYDSRPAIREFSKPLLDALAIMEHDRWVAERKVNNWKYGDPSVKKLRINKNLVDWKELSPEIKQYDYDAVSRIPKLLESVGRKMVEKVIE